MPRMISVASRAHTPITITGQTKEGEAAPEAVLWPCKPGDPPMITKNVDSDLFYDWIGRNRMHPAVVHNWLEVLPLVDEPKGSAAKAPDPSPGDAGKAAAGAKP